MSRLLSKVDLLADLRTQIGVHQTTVMTHFQPLDAAQLAWKPAPKEWSILQAFDHLNVTHAYYMPKIDQALARPVPASAGQDVYRSSFWARAYMAFAFNPRFSFPAPGELVPGTDPDRRVLEIYLENQEILLCRLDEVAAVDLVQTRIPIKRGVEFNLGDCLKILVYHDELHIDQALGVRAHLPTATRSAAD